MIINDPSHSLTAKPAPLAVSEKNITARANESVSEQSEAAQRPRGGSAALAKPAPLAVSEKNIILQPNPFEPHRRQSLAAGATIAETLDRHAQTQGLRDADGRHLVPFIVIADGEAVLQQHWSTTAIDNHRLIIITVLPQGGASKLLGTVLALAVAVAAPVFATASWGLGLAAGSFAATAATAAITLGGSLLVGALFGASQPRLPEFGDTPAPSPTYSLSARGNSARLGQPVPIIYGKHRIYPDLAAAPWVRYEDNEQFLHQLLMIGQGEYVLSDIAIDDTPIANFAEVSIQIINPGDAITLFDPDYTTAPEVVGQELTYNEAVGGFIVNPADTRTTEIHIDIVAPRGLYEQEDDGSLSSRSVSWRVEYRQIDDDGVPLGGWSILATEMLHGSTNTAQRRSYKYRVASGRYQLRLIRTTAESDNIRIVDTIHWQAARARLSRDTDTQGVTLLAIKMRATNNLSHRSRRLVSCLASRKVPIWDATSGWSTPTETRSPAWAIADIAKSGGNLPDNRIDLAALKRLDTLWAGRNDYFDAVFDTSITVWEALNRTARAGRAGCFLQGGVLRVVRDQAQSLPVAMFTPRNIIRHSLKIDYRLADDDTATAVKVKFHNRRSWLNDEVTVSLEGDTSENNTGEAATISLFGVTTEAQAQREGLYLARANRYRRKAIQLTTELEGMIPTYGDLIHVVHQQPRWGAGGEVVAYDSASRRLTLSEPVDWQDRTQGYIMLRSGTGDVQGTWSVTKGYGNNQVILPDDASPPTISISGDREKTHYGFALTRDDIGITARVIGIKPRNQSRIDITALTEDSRVHLE